MDEQRIADTVRDHFGSVQPMTSSQISRCEDIRKAAAQLIVAIVDSVGGASDAAQVRALSLIEESVMYAEVSVSRSIFTP